MHGQTDTLDVAFDKLKTDVLIHMYLQSGTAYYKNAMNQLVTIPNIIIGAVLSVSILSTQSHIWKITSGVLAVTSTVLSSLSKHMKNGEEAQLHCVIVKKYNEVLLDIDKYILTNTISISAYEEVQTQVKKLYEIQPDPSMFVVKYFNQRYLSAPYVLHPELEHIAKARARSSIFIMNRRFDKLLFPNTKTEREIQV